jgi:hypothetical protein
MKNITQKINCDNNVVDGTHLVHSQLSATTDGPDGPTAYGVTSPTKATTSVWRSRALHYTGLKEIVEIDEWIQVGDHVAWAITRSLPVCRT